MGIGGPAEIDINRDVILKVLTIFGSLTFSKSELIETARFFVDTKAPLDKLITHRYSLDQAVEAFETFDGATTGKCVFVFDEQLSNALRAECVTPTRQGGGV